MRSLSCLMVTFVLSILMKMSLKAPIHPLVCHVLKDASFKLSCKLQLPTTTDTAFLQVHRYMPLRPTLTMPFPPKTHKYSIPELLRQPCHSW